MPNDMTPEQAMDELWVAHDAPHNEQQFRTLFALAAKPLVERAVREFDRSPDFETFDSTMDRVLREWQEGK